MSEHVVLCLDPAFFKGATVRSLRKWAKKQNHRTIRYGNIPLPHFAEKGCELLHQELLVAAGPVTVLGWSEGAQVAVKWLREYAPSTPFIADLDFVLIGNPERKYGGACVVANPPRHFGVKPTAAYGGCGFPEDTPYKVTDFARQYDGWADLPTSLEPGKAARKVPSDGIHMNYFKVGLDDADVLSCVEGNVTYLLKPTRHRLSEEAEVDYERPFVLA
jgi:hypothetical protein